MKLLVTHEVDANGPFCDGCIHYPDPATATWKITPVCNLFQEFLAADLHGSPFRCEACTEAEARANKVAASAARLNEVLA